MDPKIILVAYQDNLWAGSFSTYFQRLGYRVERADLVSETIKRIRGERIPVVLLDDELEGVKAYDLVPLFKRLNPRVQVIVISSEEEISSVKRLRGAGIFYQAMKPVDLEEVGSAVECAFEKVDRENLKKGGISFLLQREAPA